MKNREPHALSSTLQLARGLAMALAVAASAGGVAAQTYINATVGGQIAPGVYGRVDIGNSAPALLYPQPVVIAPPAVYVPRSPILYVCAAGPCQELVQALRALLCLRSTRVFREGAPAPARQIPR